MDIKAQERFSPVEMALSKSTGFGDFEKDLVKLIRRSVSPDIADRTTITFDFFDQSQIIFADLFIASTLPTDVPPNFKTLIFMNYGNIHLTLMM